MAAGDRAFVEDDLCNSGRIVAIGRGYRLYNNLVVYEHRQPE